MERRERTLREEVSKLRSITSTIAKEMGLLKPQDNGNLHPYGKVNVQENRFEVQKSLLRLKECVQQYKSWSAITDEGTIKRFLNKTRDEVGERKRLEQLKSSLTKCRVLGTRYLERNGVKPTRKQGTSTRSRLQMAVASIPGLKYYEEDHDDGLSDDDDQDGEKTITLTSPTILLDVKVNADDITEEVDFNIGEDREERLSQQLLDKLKAEKFLDFEELLSKAAARYNKLDLLEEFYPGKELKRVLFALESDLKAIYLHQKAHYGIEETFRRYNGIITKQWEGYWIHYYMPKTPLPQGLSLESVESLETTAAFPFYSTLVELEHGPHLNALPKTSQIHLLQDDGGVSFFPPIVAVEAGDNVNFAEDVRVNFVLKLSPTVPMVTPFFKKILKIAGIPFAEEKLSLLEVESTGFPLNRLILKFEHKMRKKGRKGESESERAKPKKKRQKIVPEKTSEQVVQNVHFLDGQRQEFIDSRQPKGILVQRIPFTHTSQIGDILKLLRQQVVFNQLYTSCFLPSESRGALTENRGALTESRGALTESRGALTESRGALTENWGALTENWGALTENWGALTESQGALTENQGALLTTPNVYGRSLKFVDNQSAEMEADSLGTSRKRKFDEMDELTPCIPPNSKDIVVEVVCSPPTKISLTLMNPYTHHLLSIEIDILPNGDLTTDMYASGGELPCTPQELATLVTETHDLSLTLYRVFQ